MYNKLDEYNFTIDESSVDYEQVAIDPEMLGKVFENLLACIPDEEGKPLRKSTGSFYTPRQIVNYMCEQSIREYLYNQYPDNNKYKEEIDYIIDTKDFD
ncbi:MAG: hypothetical protein QM532_03230 [Cyanobium sp. MAG06]|nr:hypothetical protein [Cyanobium sp. MAG06]